MRHVLHEMMGDVGIPYAASSKMHPPAGPVQMKIVPHQRLSAFAQRMRPMLKKWIKPGGREAASQTIVYLRWRGAGVLLISGDAQHPPHRDHLLGL
ncbi:hypothetical protein [Sphingomonas abietis]|uniref:Uncharacterized protein n=1 Tax=Sphingomonas abietis TaxID=3012344 RepID=A0ABY7NRZ1_9SPHN|nr:hypothetical protein [Sphingomonas abietis]WBO23565.1 hypothetical protein PBT88_05395 [Sphingomonas abietis]